MMMGSGSTTTMTTPMSTATSSGNSTMIMTSTSSSMDMDSTSTSTSDSMDMDSGMNSYLTTDYSGYAVVFKTLTAASGGAAFGIFCILFFTAFAFRGISFLQAYVEQKVFQDSNLKEDDETASEESLDVENKCCGGPSTETTNILQETENTAQRSPLAKFFHITPQSLYRDFIRLIMVFVSTMLGYALMLAVMSFVLPYFFAVVLGVSFGEIFFLRLSHAFGIRPAGTYCVSIH